MPPEAAHALWTFPAVILSAFLIAWAAECGQFHLSQGLALAILAWLQTLPEFAVEAVITYHAGKDISQVHLVTANFTGSLRLFIGLGWPLVYFTNYVSHRMRTGNTRFTVIELHEEHAIGIMSLLPPLVYFLIIYFKGSLSRLDGLFLAGIYFVYLFLESRMPAQEAEKIEETGFIPKKILTMPSKTHQVGWITGLFLIGGVILFFAVDPFLKSMLGLAVFFGVSQFVFVQWVAPFLSEFPEKLSAFYWARRKDHAPMALMNFVSSSINQWTILTATIPFIFAWSLGEPSAVPFDYHQRSEILLTIAQSLLGFVFLLNMKFSWWEATGLFVLWLIQFLIPSIRETITLVYAAWIGWEVVLFLLKKKSFNAISALSRTLHRSAA